MLEKNAEAGIPKDLVEEELKLRTRKLLLSPLRIIAYLTIITGLFALIFEVRHFHEHSFSIYYARYIAITVAFWVLLVANTKSAHQYATLLVHLLLITIILSFGWMIYILPKTIMLNSSIAALTIFTASVFLSWDMRNQIIVAIYYNLIFAASLFLNKQNIYSLPNIFETVVLVMFLSILSIVASTVNFQLRKKVLIRSIQVSRSEKKYREIFNSAVNGLFQLSKDWDFTLSNSSLKNILGYKTDFELTNVNFPKQHFKDELEIVKIQNKLKYIADIEKYQISLKRFDGSEIIVNLNLRADKENGAIKGYEGSIEDITHEVKARELLVDAKNKAEQSERLKSEFLAQMSHEIRTPLNALLTSINVIQDETTPEQQNEMREYFEIIDFSSSRIMRTIDLILDMSEMESGSYQPTISSFDIHDRVLLNIFKEYQSAAKAKKLEFLINNSATDSNVKADEYAVEQIFSNLIDNAIKFTDKGRVEINLYRNFEEKIVVDVTDTGIGINEEYIPSLFTAFTQEYEGYSRRFEGNGLGMALVKKYADLINAEILVESKKGEGTKFSVIFS